jgi:hypothetical protein
MIKKIENFRDTFIKKLFFPKPKIGDLTPEELDTAMKEMECWLVQIHVQKCENCRKVLSIKL